MMLVQTVHENFEGFTKQEVEPAKEVRKLHNHLGQLSKTELKGMLQEKDKVSHALLKNCDLTVTDMENTKAIFGPSVPRLKGTSVQMKPVRAEPNFVKIPRDLVAMN